MKMKGRRRQKKRKQRLQRRRKRIRKKRKKVFGLVWRVSWSFIPQPDRGIFLEFNNLNSKILLNNWAWSSATELWNRGEKGLVINMCSGCIWLQKPFMDIVWQIHLPRPKATDLALSDWVINSRWYPKKRIIFPAARYDRKKAWYKAKHGICRARGARSPRILHQSSPNITHIGRWTPIR